MLANHARGVEVVSKHVIHKIDKGQVADMANLVVVRPISVSMAGSDFNPSSFSRYHFSTLQSETDPVTRVTWLTYVSAHGEIERSDNSSVETSYSKELSLQVNASMLRMSTQPCAAMRADHSRSSIPFEARSRSQILLLCGSK